MNYDFEYFDENGEWAWSHQDPQLGHTLGDTILKNAITVRDGIQEYLAHEYGVTDPAVKYKVEFNGIDDLREIIRPQQGLTQLENLLRGRTVHAKVYREPMDPSDFHDEIEEAVNKTIERAHALLDGTTDEYDNLHQVLTSFAFEVKSVLER